jgi:hypothetical protein
VCLDTAPFSRLPVSADNAASHRRHRPAWLAGRGIAEPFTNPEKPKAAPPTEYRRILLLNIRG